MKNLNHRVISQYIIAVFFFIFVLFFGFKNMNLIAKALQSAKNGTKAEVLIDGMKQVIRMNFIGNTILSTCMDLSQT